ncbi:MAG TPA: type IVB secretion system protein IcmH/DotU [Blastocatellia bacterium]|nr:type IVB secretion system protein IcmH/DotU [Blastocatellia bacterium]
MSSTATQKQMNASQQSAEKDLVSLATPVLDLVMRMRAGQIQPSAEMRQLVDGRLKELDVRGAQLGYKEQQLQNVKFALAAFVDETVLAGGFEVRNEWERYPLQLQYFQEQFAGVKFFDRLDALLKNAESEADVIEVYYLCLLLGFKGKYHIYMEDQLPGVLQNVAGHLQRVGRLKNSVLSPHWKVSDQPAPPQETKVPTMPAWVKMVALGSLALVALSYLLFQFLLTNQANGTNEILLK